MDFNEKLIYDWVLVLWVALALVTFPVLFKIPAPYGKFTRDGWGLKISSRVGWIVQECPSFLVYFGLFLNTDRREIKYYVLSFMFLVHYFNRAFVFPMRMKGDKTTTVYVVLSAFFFTVTNAYLIGRGMLYFDSPLSEDFWYDWVRYLGMFLWGLGFYFNLQSDAILRNLRKPHESDYKIPYGGVFYYVTAANYFTETIEWLGFAIVCQTPATWAFFLWCVANLLPRAISQHQWYLQKFEDYKTLNRSAYIPFLL